MSASAKRAITAPDGAKTVRSASKVLFEVEDYFPTEDLVKIRATVDTIAHPDSSRVINFAFEYAKATCVLDEVQQFADGVPIYTMAVVFYKGQFKEVQLVGEVNGPRSNGLSTEIEQVRETRQMLATDDQLTLAVHRMKSLDTAEALHGILSLIRTHHIHALQEARVNELANIVEALQILDKLCAVAEAGKAQELEKLLYMLRHPAHRAMPQE